MVNAEDPLRGKRILPAKHDPQKFLTHGIRMDDHQEKNMARVKGGTSIMKIEVELIQSTKQPTHQKVGVDEFGY